MIYSVLCEANFVKKLLKCNEWLDEDFRNVWTSSDVLMSLQENPNIVAWSRRLFLVPLQNMTVLSRLNPSGHNYAAQFHIIRVNASARILPTLFLARHSLVNTAVLKYCLASVTGLSAQWKLDPDFWKDHHGYTEKSLLVRQLEVWHKPSSHL